MAQSREEKNRKLREKNAKLKEKGLSYGERRSVKKAVSKNPSLIDAIGGLVRGIVKGADDLAQQAADVLTGGAKQLTKETTKNVPRGTKKKAAPSPKKSNYIPKTVISKKTGKRIPTFDNFVKQQKKKNPNVSANKLKADYREKGGTIGNVKAYSEVREVTGVPRDRSKRTVMKYHGKTKNPLGYKYIKEGKKSRYMYLVRYGLEVEGMVELETNYITLSSPDKLSEEEIVESVILELADLERKGFARGGKGDKKEYYVTKGLNVESIHIEYAIDMEKP